MIQKEIGKIRLDFLKTYIELIKVKNFSKAAENLSITQGTVSQHLKELEKSFGNVKLINRTSKLFEITREGEIIYDISEKIMVLLENAREDLIRLSDNQKVIVKIVTSSIPGSYIIPKLLMQIQPDFPNVEFDIDVSNSYQALQQVQKGNVHFCAIGSLFDSDIDKLNYVKIGEDQIQILARVDHPVHEWLKDVGHSITKNDLLSELIKFPWIFREQGSATRDWFLKNWPKDKKINIALDFHDNIAIINALRKSNAITALSSKIIENISRNRDIKPIKHKFLPTISRSFYLVSLKEQKMTNLDQELWNSFNRIILK